MMGYLCETTSIEGLVQLLACNYLPHGYWFYVSGWVPDGKDPRQVDAKLIDKYRIELPRATRTRRKQLGYANLQYLRYGRFFVLLATHGKHRFHEEEAACIRDVRRIPIRFAGYSISYRRGNRRVDGTPDAKWHSHVEIDRQSFQQLQAWLVDRATRCSAEGLALEFYRIPFEPYAPVRRQMLRLLRIVNQARKQAGREPIPHAVLPLRRRVVRPFEPRESGAIRVPERDDILGLRRDNLVACCLGSEVLTVDSSEILMPTAVPHKKDGRIDGK